MARMSRTLHRRSGLLALTVGLAIVLSGCGGDDGPDLPDGAVATVDGAPISRESFDHWLEITRREAEQGDSPLDDKGIQTSVLNALIRAKWAQGEADALGVNVPDAKIDEELARTRKLTFAGGKTFPEYLEQTGLTEADLRQRIRNGALTLALNRQFKQAAEEAKAPNLDQALIAANRAYAARWKAKTVCEQDLATKDCSNYRTSG